MKLKMLMVASAATLAIATPLWAADGPRFGSWGYDASAMDQAVKPGDDFFDYVNGAWAARTEIAPDRTFAGIDSVLNDQIDKDVRTIVEDMAKNPAAAGKIGQQVGDFYASWMDEAAIEARGTAPLKPWLARIAAVGSTDELADLWAQPGYTGPVGFGIIPDPQDPTRYVAIAGQGGLGMPNRDYYLLQGAKYDGYRKAYRNYIIKVHQLAGIANAEARADRIIALETAIAKDQWTPERNREIKDIYNPMDRAKMEALAPQFDWGRMLTKAGLASQPTVVVMQPSFFTAAGKMLESVPLATWKDYVAYHFISSHAQFLPHAFDQASFDFFSKTLRDVPVQRDRWKRGVALVNGALGEAVGQIYVQRHYPPESDRQMGELIANLRAALQDKIEHNSWMDSATKTEALAKLADGLKDPRERMIDLEESMEN